MNKAILVGRLGRDPEVRSTNNGIVVRFSMAVDRKFKDANGEYGCDFINCIAFGKTAEFIEKYFSKGMRIGIAGHIQTGSYTDNNGGKKYFVDVVADEAEFVESKHSQNNENNTSQNTQPTNNTPRPVTQADIDGFMNIPDGIDEELPFN